MVKKTLYKRRFALFIIAVLLVTLLPLPVRAEPTPGRTPIGRADHAFFEMPSSFYSSQPSINSKAAILVDLGTGTILFEKNIHQQKYPASTTKVMTALLALENLRVVRVDRSMEAALASLDGTGYSFELNIEG